MPDSIYYLKRRNALANTVIQRYAERSRFLNVGVNITGLFVPGGSLLALLTTLATQAPAIYKPLVNELSSIYLAEPDMITRGQITDAVLTTTGHSIRNSLIVDFGPEFFFEVLQVMWPELGLGALTSVIPLVSAVVAMTLDATFAATMTWQVGTMTAMYFMNDEAWVISQKETRNLARKQTGLPSPRATRPGVLNSILPGTPEIRERILGHIDHAIDVLRQKRPGITPEQIRSILAGQGIDDPTLLEESLRRRATHP
jgi:hypothetical protein